MLRQQTRPKSQPLIRYNPTAAAKGLSTHSDKNNNNVITCARSNHGSSSNNNNNNRHAATGVNGGGNNNKTANNNRSLNSSLVSMQSASAIKASARDFHREHASSMIIKSSSSSGCGSLIKEEDEEEEINLSSPSCSSGSSSSLASSSLSLSTESSTSTVLAALTAKNSSGNNGKQQQSNYVRNNDCKGSSDEDMLDADDYIAQKKLSSNASTSSNESNSSSGLSSMNSGQSTGDVNNNSRRHQREQAIDNEVGQCIEQLVSSVASEQPGGEDGQEVFFGLHEAKLAQTRSNTTSGSSDDESGGFDRTRSFRSNASRSSVRTIRDMSRNDQTVAKQKRKVDALMVRELQDVDCNSTRQGLQRLARQYIASELERATGDTVGEISEPNWFVGVDGRHLVIEYKNSDLELCQRHIPVERVLDCILDQQFVFWIIERSTSNDDVSNSGCNEQSTELETTLDDIAAALDEPISGSDGGAANERNKGKGVSVLIWLSPTCEQAIELRDDWLTATSRSVGLISDAPESLVKDCSIVVGADEIVKPLGESKSQVDVATGASAASSNLSVKELTVQPATKARSTINSGGGSTMAAPVGCLSTGRQQKIISGVSSIKSAATPVTRRIASRQSQASSPSTTTTTRNGHHQCNRSAIGCSSHFDDGSGDGKSRKNDSSASATNALKKNGFGYNGGHRSTTDAPAAAALSGAARTASNSSLASYYKTIANKVLSNGSSRIKSFRDEMIRFNSWMPPQQQQQSRLQQQQVDAASTPVVSDVEDVDWDGQEEADDHHVKAKSHARPSSIITNDPNIDSGNDKQSEDIAEPKDHQDRSVIGNPAVRQPIKNSTAAESSGNGQTAVPTVKPRTSILKSKQRVADGRDDATPAAIDSNNNSDSKIAACADSGKRFRSAPTTTSGSGKPNADDYDYDDCYYLDRDGDNYKNKAKNAQTSSIRKRALAATSTGHDDDHQVKSITKLKSILKTSKTSSPSSSALEATIASSREVGCQINSLDTDSDESDQVDAHGGKLPSRQQQSTVADCNQASRKQLRRRSLVDYNDLNGQQTGKGNKQHQVNDADVDHDLDKGQDCVVADTAADDSVDREQAFERMRSRASFYDISRLMTKNNVQTQLIKLRSGTINASATKSRQRRPPMLLNDQLEQDQAEKKQEQTGRQQVSDNAAAKRSSMVVTTSKSTVDPDGTVRVRVGPLSAAGNLYQRQSISNVDWQHNDGSGDGEAAGEDDGATGSGQRVVRAQVAVKQQASAPSGAVIADDSGLSSTRGKNSEFDPRSLRRFASVNVKHSLKSSEKTSEKNRKSIVVSNKSEGDSQTEAQQAKQADAIVASSSNEDETTDCDDEDDDGQGSSGTRKVSATVMAAAVRPHSNSLSKSGPFSLLRQSFNQKTLSSMLKFSSRASMRVKVPSSSTPATGDSAANKSLLPAQSSRADELSLSSSTASIKDKNTALAIAEANLLAAKQLKLQAQKLKEQQKREQQQQQQLGSIDSTAMMLAATMQYNQQLQRHQQQQVQVQQAHQQQQVIYHQYAMAARAHSSQMYDASSASVQMHQHQIQMYQRLQQQQQQQQQVAYITNMNTAHYMTQPMALPVPTAVAAPLAVPPAMYGMQHQAQFQVPSVSSDKSLRSSSKLAQQHQHLMYQQQQQQQLIPMAVNHHSSFNIVYAGQPAVSSQAQSADQYLHLRQHPYQCAGYGQGGAHQPPKSSLGASMRKTVKSILINRPAFFSSSSSNNGDKHQEQPTRTIGASIKSSEINLNSEGSDGDGSSSDSTTATSSSTATLTPNSDSSLIEGDNKGVGSSSSSNINNSNKASQLVKTGRPAMRGSSSKTNPPKSVLKKTSGTTARSSQQHQQQLSRQQSHDQKTNSRNQLETNRKSQNLSENAIGNNSSSNVTRKNVTFSTKLTSIL